MSNGFDKAVGQRLRRLRTLRGMTQQDLAARLGVSFQQVQKYERGANKLSFERVWHLSDMFNVPLSSWADGVAAGQTDAELEACDAKPVPEHSRHALQLLQAFHAIKTEERRSLVCALAVELGG